MCLPSTDGMMKGTSSLVPERALLYGNDMSSWAEFAKEAADLAGAAKRRLVGSDGVAIGFLATVSAHGKPRLAPVCPIFCGDHLYICAVGHTSKVHELRRQHAYVLHAFLGSNDEEVQVGGTAIEVLDLTERAAVHKAIPFKSFYVKDPIFRLTIDRALWVYWERSGEPDTKPIRQRWKSGDSTR